MRSTIKIFKIFGISVEIHFTFLILPVIFGIFAGLKGIVLILFVFLCVTMHEIVHSIQANRFGAKAQKIVLFPIGGIAMMKSMPEKPRQEFIIAISGPLFNLALAAVLYFPLKKVLGEQILLQFPPTLATWKNTIAYMFWINPILAVFNLLPAFPMDGGRVFRAFLAQYLDYRKATRIAVALGHAIAVFLAFMGLMSVPRNYILVIIAVFVYVAASHEEAEVEVKSTLAKIKVQDILSDEYKTVTGDMSLAQVLEIVFHSHHEDFPVLENGKLVGLLTRSVIIKGVHQYSKDKKVSEIMRKQFPTLSPNDLLKKAHLLMQESQVRAIPVLRKGELCGIVTVEDLTKIYALMSDRMV